MIDLATPPWERLEASDLIAGFLILTKGKRLKGKEAKRKKGLIHILSVDLLTF
jgi:hypothetical protein